jgi:hypothetical protein
MTTELEQEFARRLVQYAAGTAIACPVCGIILDRSRTVLHYIGPDTGGATYCASCWDAQDPKPAGTATYDGRALFKEINAMKEEPPERLGEHNGWTVDTDGEGLILTSPDGDTEYCDPLDSISIAACEECCEIEPDGRCQHGNPSAHRIAGLA